MNEIFLLTLSESVKAAFLFAAAWHFLPGGRAAAFARMAALSVVAGLAAGLFYPLTETMRNDVMRVFFAVQAVLLALALLPDSDRFKSGALWSALAIAFFLLPSAIVAFSIKSAAVTTEECIKGGVALVLGVAAAVSVYTLISRLHRRTGLFRAFTARGLMVLLCSINLLLIQGGGFSHLSFVLTAQTYSAQALVQAAQGVSEYFLFPRHEFVVTPFRGALDFMASPELAMLLTASLLLTPPLFAAMGAMLGPEPDTNGMVAGAVKRKFLKSFRTDVLLKALAPIAALVLNAAVLHGANLDLNPLYDPVPRPLLAADGIVRVPVFGPDAGGDVTDEKLRKFSIGAGESRIVILVMMRPDGAVMVSLDACEICSPKGYGQKGDTLVCKYCNTPMPVSALGMQGGCNPIPVESVSDGDYMLVKTSDLLKAAGRAGGRLGEWH